MKAVGRFLSVMVRVLLVLGVTCGPAVAQSVSGACLYSLDPTAQQAFYISGNATVKTNCSIVTESSASNAFEMGGVDTLYLGNHAEVGVVGGWQLNGQSMIDTITNQSVQPVSISSPGDPLASVPVPTQGAIISPAPVIYNSSNAPPNDTLSPGVYCGGFTIANTGGVNFTMTPGTYIVAGGGFKITSSAMVQGQGVTVYNTSSAGWGCNASYSYTPISIDGQASVNLSAPTSGPLAGIVLFGDRNGCSTPGACKDIINGQATATFNGVIYTKSDLLVFNGKSQSTGCVAAVADKIQINGDTLSGGSDCFLNPIGITVSPQTAALYGGQSQQFTAKVTNTYFTSVKWTISPAAGSIDASGNYTAPPTISTEQTVTVTATSQADTTKSASAVVTLFPPETISITPTNSTVNAGSTQPIHFTATVTNALNTAVNWTVSSGLNEGSIDASGNYTPPATVSGQEEVTVTATSVANPSLSASATVTVNPANCTPVGYQYGRRIVIDHTKVANSDQTNFPFLFDSTDPSFATVANGGHVTNSSGYDIIFSTDPAGQHVLNFQIEKYDPVTGHIVAWINLPDLSHTSDTVLYMLYGNSAVTTSQQNSAGVWSNGYVGVYHLGDGTTLNLNNSANTSNDLENNGAGATTGEIDGGASFNGGQYAYTKSPVGLPTGTAARTFSLWFKMSANNANEELAGWGDNSGNGDRWGAWWNGSRIGIEGENEGASVSMTYDNNWHYLVAVSPSGNSSFSNISIYVDGVLQPASGSGTIHTTGSNIALGTIPGALGIDNFQGSLDEVRISNVARSADWIATSYNNQSSPSTFYSLQPESTLLVNPASVNLYAGQTESFSATILNSGACTTNLQWAMPPDSPGMLSTAGVYTAPSLISAPQRVLITATNLDNTTQTGTAQVTLLPPPSNPTLTLAAAIPGPYVTGATESFSATLTNHDGVPVPGASVTFTVTGVNPTTGTATTNSNGVASFAYTGANSGRDALQAIATIDGVSATSNQLSVSWFTPTQPISTGTVSARFYLSPDNSPFFDTPPTATPAFSQAFPNINFDPIPGRTLSDGTTIWDNTRPFTDVTTDGNGNLTGTIVAQGNGYQAGSGQMNAFQAVFTGSYTVAHAGDVTINISSDDGLVLGIGGGATRVSGPMINPPASGTTAFNNYPVVAAFAEETIPPFQGAVVVDFPAPGTYPYEIDYSECCGGALSLAVFGKNSGTSLPPAGYMAITPNYPAPIAIGKSQSLTVFVVDGAANPVPDLPVTFTISGANPQELSATTDATGHATIQYSGVNAGTDIVHANAVIDGAAAYANAVSVTWTGASQTTTTGGSGTMSVSITGANTIVLPNTLPVSGSATDSSLPAGDTISTTWSEVSGPGTVTFANPQQLSTTASFSAAGTYVLQLTASDSLNSGTAQLQVTVDPAPEIDQGWIGTPAYGSTVSGVVPINVASGTTLQSGELTYYPAGDTTDVTVLNGDTTGSGQIGTFDTTNLPNGTYWIQLQGTDTSGKYEYSLVLVTVTGQNKPGRVTATVTDLVVPAMGLPIKIQRHYDSLNASRSEDFGYGWSLGTSVDLSVDPAGNVTFTLNGQRKTFFFKPFYGGWLFPWYFPAFTPQPGLHGTLTESGSGCFGDFDFLVPDGNLWACIGGGFYTPPGYIYTDPSGTSYTISAKGNLQSITDRNGNTLTMGASGITSSTGLNVQFSRDSSGRITKIVDSGQNTYLYHYDSNGNLTSVTYPGVSTATTYTYDTSHHLTGGTDFNGNSLPTVTYFGSSDKDVNGLPLTGKLESVKNALGQVTSYVYNLDTNTTTITYPKDASGNQGTAAKVYDSYGDLKSSTDPLGHTTKYNYDADHNLIQKTDPMGFVTTYAYDQNGNRTSVTYPATATSTDTTNTTKYNQYSEPTSTTDEMGNVRTFTYDVNYNPETITDSLGTLASFVFNTNGQMAEGAIGYDIAAQPSMATKFSYDSDGNLIGRTDALGRTTSYTYNSLGQKVSMTIPVPSGSDATAATTNFVYDALGNLTETDAPLGRKTSATYDGNGNKISSTDANGNVTTYQYDALNRLIETDYPDGTKETKSYDFRGNVVDEIGRNGQDTHYTYNLAGQMVSMTKAYGTQDAKTTTYTYDADGRKLTMTDPRGNTTTYSYDAAGNLTAVSGPGGNFQYGYDNARNRISMTDGDGNTTHYQYDARKRLIKTTYQDGTTVQYSYDGPGNLASVTDQAKNVVDYYYDAANELTSVVQTDSPNTGNDTTSYGYNVDGGLTSLTDANGHATQDVYNLLYEPVSTTLPDGTLKETRKYDAQGNLTSLTNFNQDTTTYHYDAMNRLLSRVPDPATNEATVSFTYWPSGQRKTMSDASGETQYFYNSLNQLTQKVTPEGTLNYTYDASGNLASMSTADGRVSVDYTWDNLNRLSSVTDNNLTGTSNTTNYTYDAANNVATATYPNGVESTYQYDAENRLQSMTEGQTGYDYGRGSTGNLTSATELSGRLVSWSFDGIYRLTGETISEDPSKANGSVSYTLDPVGNRLSDASSLSGVNSGSFSYNPDDELASETYDADGNVTAANGNAYQYDSQNELVGMNGGAVRLVYDGDGNRVAKTVNGVTTRYLVDDLNPTGYAQVVEETVNGAPQRTYTYGLQRISENQIVNNKWTPSFYEYDGMGSVRQLTDSAGAVTDTYEYDAFGNLLNKTGTTPNEMLYRGEQWDPDLGLYYLRARWYDPITGRFVARDPNKGVTTDPKTLHKYLYADGDPVNGMDPTGRDDLIEVGNLDGELSTAENKQLEEIGQEVDCQFKTDAAVLGDAIAPAGETLVSLIPEGEACSAKATYCSEPEGRIGYRAVSEAELYAINEGGFSPSPMGGEVKYFSDTVQQAWDFARRSYKDGNFGIVRGEFPCSVPVDNINPATEGPGFTVPNEYLSQGKATILWP